MNPERWTYDREAAAELRALARSPEELRAINIAFQEEIDTPGSRRYPVAHFRTEWPPLYRLDVGRFAMIFEIRRDSHHVVMVLPG
jgi:mRNA-degrading endonuclease RelE of RelBE toxin-antitoxin system